MPNHELNKKVGVSLAKLKLLKAMMQLSIKQALIFALVFGAIGGFSTHRSLAADQIVATVEAENMTPPLLGARVVVDTAASGLKALKLTQNGTATASVSLSSAATDLTITARGDQCSGSPAMAVTVDDRNVFSNTSVSSSAWTRYNSPTISLGSGSHRLSVTASNLATVTKGKSKNSCARVLYLDITTFIAAPITSPTNTSLPTISGIPAPGRTLTGTNGTWTGSPTSYAYQWGRCDSLGNNCADISGATTINFLLSSADVGSTIRFTVFAANAAGTTAATSDATAVAEQGTVTIPLGGAVAYSPLFTDSAYQSLFLNKFYSMTTENEMKWAYTEPRQNQFDFSKPDQMVSFALTHGKYVRGHTLVWHYQLPGWVTGGTWTRDTLSAAMTNHITTEAGHYAGQVGEWDVVNEAFNDSGGYRDSIFYSIIGSQYIEEAFIAAHQADPNAKLCYNDYGIEAIGTKSDLVYNMVADFKARGIPIDCVGMQAHWSMSNYHTTADVTNNMTRFANLGVTVEITEADVTSSSSKWTGQAAIFGYMADACSQVAACTRFTTWGLTDKYSWLGSSATPLLFDANYQPKPAYDTVRTSLRLP